MNIGFLWLVRSELNNAGVAGALACAKVKCGSGQTHSGGESEKSRKADRAARQFIESNRLLKRRILLQDANDDHSFKRRAVVHGRILFGVVEGRTFRATSSSRRATACLVELSTKVNGPPGWLRGPRTIHVRTVAVCDDNSGTPRLVEVDTVRTD